MAAKTLSVAVLLMVTLPPPRAFAEVAARVPWETVSPPLKVLLPPSETSPTPVLFMAFAPEIDGLMVSELLLLLFVRLVVDPPEPLNAISSRVESNVVLMAPDTIVMPLAPMVSVDVPLVDDPVNE
ncbi:MAG: hypothetical protein WCR51_03725 [Planctomycetia bacterium]